MIKEYLYSLMIDYTDAPLFYIQIIFRKSLFRVR